MKESSYFTTSLEAPTRILRTNLGDPSRTEERSKHRELAAVTHHARLPQSIEQKANQFRSRLIRRVRDYLGIVDEDDKDKTLIFQKYESFNEYVQQNNKLNKLAWKELSGERERIRKQRLNDIQKTHPAKLCVVPWPDFCVYPSPSDENRGFLSKLWNNYISPSERSPFANTALNGTSEMFSEVSMEAIIKFKW